jgi:hypothetical protein
MYVYVNYICEKSVDTSMQSLFIAGKVTGYAVDRHSTAFTMSVGFNEIDYSGAGYGWNGDS